MSLLIGDKLVVSMHYTLTDDDNNVIDSSDGGEPLTYLHGASNIIPGLEKELIGKTEGASLKVTVEPAEGYGEISDDLIQTVNKAAFEGVESIEAGMSFQAQGPDGNVQNIVVKEVNGDDVLVDGNHPLAGKTLHFDVTVVTIRDATEEEIAHGHVH